MSKNEVGHINESLKTKAIPTSKLLIKYHKKLTSMGEFPTTLVIQQQIYQLFLQRLVTWG